MLNAASLQIKMCWGNQSKQEETRQRLPASMSGAGSEGVNLSHCLLTIRARYCPSALVLAGDVASRALLRGTLPIAGCADLPFPLGPALQTQEGKHCL